jgi:hypothetical protein
LFHYNSRNNIFESQTNSFLLPTRAWSGRCPFTEPAKSPEIHVSRSLKPWGLSWFITSCILLGRIGVPFYFHACTTLHCTQINDRCWDWLESTRQWCRLVLSEIPEGSLVAAFRQTDRALRFSWSWACFIVPRSCVRFPSTREGKDERENRAGWSRRQTWIPTAYVVRRKQARARVLQYSALSLLIVGRSSTYCATWPAGWTWTRPAWWLTAGPRSRDTDDITRPASNPTHSTATLVVNRIELARSLSKQCKMGSAGWRSSQAARYAALYNMRSQSDQLISRENMICMCPLSVALRVQILDAYHPDRMPQRATKSNS